MKRWRPPTRPLILIALLLLAGAVVNVAVAWGIAAGAPRSFAVGSYADACPRWFVEPRWPPYDWPKGCKREMMPSFGFGHAQYDLHAVNQHGEDRSIHAETLAFGWPLRALRWGLVRQDGVERRFGGALPAPAFVQSLGWTFAATSGDLPHSVDGVGFLVNTVCYAVLVGAILTPLLTFFPVRRRLRARRGRCPKCGYDLAGLGGAEPGGEGAAPCPECGATR